MRSNLLLFSAIISFLFLSHSVLAININTNIVYDASYVNADIVVQNTGVFTINSNAQLKSITVNGGGTLIVNSPYTLTVGVSTNSATLQVVDFQNNSTVMIHSGATLFVYGLLNNSNNSTGITFDGNVSVIGNVTGGNGSMIEGQGTLATTGTIITDSSGTIFGSNGDCTTGPCNASNLSCSFSSTISGNQTICSNSIPSVLTSSTNASSPTYQWQSTITSGANFQDISGATIATYSFPGSLTQTTYFRLLVKSGTCKSSTSQVVITVNSQPVPPTANPQVLCAGKTVADLVATGTLVKWYNVNTGGSALASNIALSTGTYYASQTINGCESARTAVSVTINPLPTTPIITAGGATSFCIGGSLQLTSSPGTSYLWSTGETSQSIVVGNSGNYSVKVININGCESPISLATSVAVNTYPVITSQPVSQLDCEGKIVSFTVAATGSGLSYVWERKRPADSSYTSASLDSNVTYPTPDKLRIANVGTTQSPDSTLYRVIVSNSGCSITSNSAVLTVNEITKLTPSDTDVTQCYGTNYSYTVSVSYPANVVSYQWKKYNTVSSTWDNISNGGAFSGASSATLTITGGTPAESGSYQVYITFHASGADCNVISTSRSRSITFLPQVTTPVMSVTQPTCKDSTGSIVVSVQNVTDTYSFDGGVNYQVSNSKLGLIPGTYNVIIKNSENCLSSSSPCILIPSVTKTWNGSAWLPDLPTKHDAVVFEGNYSSSGNLEVCACKVNSGNVVFNSNHSFVVANEVNVAGGNLTFENNSSLVQTNNISNTGNIVYKRKTSALHPFDYTYWSSPVSNATLNQLATGSGYYSFNAATNSWTGLSGGNAMLVGVGYVGRASGGIPNGQVLETSFTGIPNNGDVPVSIIKGAGAMNLIGNPYPSSINADLFLMNNPSVMGGTIYFWTHNTPVANNNYSSNDYAKYNLTGGLAAVSGGSVPTKYIGAGQGFFIEADPTLSNGAYTATFKNTMRVVNDNSQFFKMSSPTAETTEKHRVWLSLLDTQGGYSQTLLGYLFGATDNFDSLYDSKVMKQKKSVSVYSIVGGDGFSIQGKSLPFSITDVIPIGYNVITDGKMSFALENFDGVFDHEYVYLYDKFTNTYQNLKEGNYDFVTTSGIHNNRFELRFSKEDFDYRQISVEKDDLKIVSGEKQLTVISPTEVISKIEIYDIFGNLLLKRENLKANVFEANVFEISPQMLIVKVVFDSLNVIIKKTATH